MQNVFEEAKTFFLAGLKDLNANSLDAAEKNFRESLRLLPNRISTMNNLAVVLIRKKEYEIAGKICLKVLELAPLDANALFNLGQVSLHQREHLRALEWFNKLIEIEPCHAEAHFHRGNAFKEIKYWKEAEEDYTVAIKLKSNLDIAYYNRGVLRQEVKKFEEALRDYEEAIRINPNHAQFHINRANVLLDLGRVKEAIEGYQQAKFIDPACVDAHWNEGLARLLVGDYKLGWPLYEWGWRNHQRGTVRLLDAPLWLGNESLDGKVIYIYSEQGLGDTIQFCRFLTRLKELGATVIFEVQEALMNLLQNISGVDVLVTKKDTAPFYDFCCPLLSLPYALGVELENINTSVPYIHSDNDKVEYWRSITQKKAGKKVGLVWHGGFRPNQPEWWSVNARRNISIDLFSRILSYADVNFFSLQKGDPAETEIKGNEKIYWPKGNFYNFADQLKDFSDTAALIANLDLVISVDTSTAHLAAAMGKPTWILNRFDTCWRWLLNRTDSPWYPSVRLYRQQQDRDWEPVLKQVYADLNQLDCS